MRMLCTVGITLLAINFAIIPHPPPLPLISSFSCVDSKFLYRGKFPAPKTIAADVVVGLICRGLSVNSATLGGKELARTAELQAALPTVHKSLLRMLSALSVCCGRALLPLAAVISKVLGQILQAAADSPVLRVEVYEALVNWMTVAGSGSCVDLISNNLISSLLKDVTVKAPAVGLKGKFAISFRLLVRC